MDDAQWGLGGDGFSEAGYILSYQEGFVFWENGGAKELFAGRGGLEGRGRVQNP
jgi:hypothetical protein